MNATERWFRKHKIAALILVALTHPIQLYRGIRYGTRLEP